MPPRLVLGSAAQVTGEVAEQLRAAFPDHLEVHLDDGGVAAAVGDAGDLVVAGGDGTVGRVLRAVAGRGRRVGLLPLGTFNNFAHSLGIPDDLEGAIRVVKTGRPRPVTLGRLAGLTFLEVAAVGAFGELIALGEAAKDLAFGAVGDHIRELSLTLVRPFEFRLTGDLELEGSARSLVFSNTPTTGARLPIGEVTPDDPYLELALHLPHLAVHEPNPRFRRLTVETDPPLPICADASEAGHTPVIVEALPGAVTVIEPAG